MRFAPETWRYAAPPLVLSIPAAAVAFPLGVLCLAVGLGTMLFFRDPERTPAGPGVVSPADGTVSVVREEEGRVRVGVFMNVTDVHVVRAPTAGYVESARHRTGGYRPAFSKESECNERLDLDFGSHEVSLIAGWFARRIVPYVAAGDTVERGERVGHIVFGSRSDVLLPPRFELDDVRVERGQHVRAGETVLVEPVDEVQRNGD